MDRQHTFESDESRQYEDRKRITFVMLGMSGSGKSRTANTILTKNVFEFGSPESRSAIKTGSARHFRFYNEVIIMEPPGFNGLDDIAKSVQHSFQGLQSGKHVFVICFEMNSYTDEYKHMIRLYEEIFGKNFYSSAVVVFTNYDSWKIDAQDKGYKCDSPDECLKTLHAFQRTIVRRCSNRYCLFNNRLSGIEREEQSKHLFAMIDDMDEAVDNSIFDILKMPFVALCRLFSMLINGSGLQHTTEGERLSSQHNKR